MTSMLSLSLRVDLGAVIDSSGAPSQVPAILSPPEISGAAEVGETLVATSGLWSNSPTSYAYQWYADAVAMTGETANSLLLTEAEEGALITVGVVATNGIGASTESVSAAAGPVVFVFDIATPALGDKYVDDVLVPDEDAAPMYSIDFVQAYPDGGGIGDTLQGRWGATEGAAEAFTPEDYEVVEAWWIDATDPMPDLTTFCEATAEDDVTHYQVRVKRVDQYSDWSAFRTFTRGADPAPPETASTFEPTTGANKSQYVTISGANLIARGNSGGFNDAPHSVRLTQSRTSGLRQCAFGFSTASGSKYWLGISDGTDHFGDTGTTNFSRPGKNNSSGYSLRWGENGSAWGIWSGTSEVQSGTVSGNGSDRSEFAMRIDYTNGTLSFWQKLSGTWSQIGTTLTGLSISGYKPDVGFENNDTFTYLNAGTKTLDGGAVAFDN